MQILLKVTLSNNQPPNQTLQHEFNERGGTIGRKISNAWVLPDENRHLSGSHAKIEYDKGSFYIIDMSTNGVFINGNTAAVGKGNRNKINSGDQLIMGTYAIQIHAPDEDIEPKGPSRQEPSDDLFSDLLDEPNHEEIEEALEKSVHNSKQNQLHDMSVGSEDPFFEGAEFSLADDEIISTGKSDVIEKASDFDRFFKPPNVTNNESQESLLNVDDDKSPDEKTGNEKISSVIPDNWIGTNENSIDELLTGIVDPFKAEEDSVDEKNKVSSLKDIEDNAVHEELPKKEGITESRDKRLKGSDTDLITAFFEGMGLDYTSEESEFTRADFRLAGSLFRNAVEGTMEVLQSRAEIKNEMRMDMTTIQPIENNPIKFSISVEGAIKKLLLEKSNTQMDPKRAMTEAYDDIKSHQVAVISGIQASLVYVLRRFEPDNLVERLERQNPISANIPVHRKAKLWEAFEQLYETIESEAEDDFNRLFGQEFAKAYEDQVTKLKESRGDE